MARPAASMLQEDSVFLQIELHTRAVRIDARAVPSAVICPVEGYPRPSMRAHKCAVVPGLRSHHPLVSLALHTYLHDSLDS
jgi:hypothetical protein